MARPQKYTQEILAQIPEMVKSGMPEAEIAARFDSTVPSLRVTCVKHKISLKQEDYVDELKFRQLSYPVELTMAERVKLLDYARVNGLRFCRISAPIWPRSAVRKLRPSGGTGCWRSVTA